MFTIDNNLQDLKVKERSIFKIIYSMNSHPVATPEMSVEEARCYILFFSEGQNLSAFIGLYLPSNDRKFFYACASNPFPFEAAADVEEEARQFAEDMGFLLDEINVSGMPVEDRNHWIEDQYIFGYKKPELPPQDEEPESVEEEEQLEEIEQPEVKPAAKEEKPAVKETKPAPKEEKPAAPAAAAPVPAQEPPRQPSPVTQAPQPPPAPTGYPPQPGQPPQPYQGYPQPGQPYQPYPGYPQPGQPFQPPQPYQGYPQPGQPYPGQPYPGYPQQMPPQYPPVPPPPELEVPELDDEDQSAPASGKGGQPWRPPAKKKAPPAKAVPSTARRQAREEEYDVEEESEVPAPRVRKRAGEAVHPAPGRPAQHRVPAAGQGTGGTVTRDKEALARLLSSF